MTDGVAIGYDTDVLLFGGAGLLGAAAAAADATRALQQAPLNPTMFGLTPGAPGFRGGGGERPGRPGPRLPPGRRARDGLAGRTDTAAGLGDGLTNRSTAIAGSAPRNAR